MTKWKDTTAGGHRILWREEIKEGERKGWFIGEIRIQDTYNIFRAWTPEGVAYLGTPELCLVPAEPEVVFIEFFTVDSAHTHRKIPIYIIYYDNGTYTVSKEEV